MATMTDAQREYLSALIRKAMAGRFQVEQMPLDDDALDFRARADLAHSLLNVAAQAAHADMGHVSGADTEAGRQVAAIVQRAAYDWLSSIDLDTLDRAAASTMIDQMQRGIAGVAAWVTANTDGTPAGLAQLVNGLASNELLRPWVNATGGNSLTTTDPATIARLQRRGFLPA